MLLFKDATICKASWYLSQSLIKIVRTYTEDAVWGIVTYPDFAPMLSVAILAQGVHIAQDTFAVHGASGPLTHCSLL